MAVQKGGANLDWAESSVGTDTGVGGTLSMGSQNRFFRALREGAQHQTYHDGGCNLSADIRPLRRRALTSGRSAGTSPPHGSAGMIFKRRRLSAGVRYTLPHQIEVDPAIHRPVDQLQPVDLSFHLSVAPWRQDLFAHRRPTKTLFGNLNRIPAVQMDTHRLPGGNRHWNHPRRERLGRVICKRVVGTGGN